MQNDLNQKNINIYLAAPRGFCAGVERAIDMVEKALKKYGKPVYLDVGKESSAYMMEDALMQMAMNGETAAWRVEVRLHTLQ